jgi:hypothetical protein
MVNGQYLKAQPAHVPHRVEHASGIGEIFDGTSERAHQRVALHDLTEGRRGISRTRRGESSPKKATTLERQLGAGMGNHVIMYNAGQQ